MFFSANKYTIQTLNNNLHKVMWQENGIRFYYELDLEKIIQDHIDHHLNLLLNAISIYDAADPNSEDETVFKNPYTADLLYAMEPYPADYAPWKLSDEQIRYNDHLKLIQAYNKLHNTTITYEMIKPHVLWT